MRLAKRSRIVGNMLEHLAHEDPVERRIRERQCGRVAVDEIRANAVVLCEFQALDVHVHASEAKVA
jgi:hypothetical protein